MRERILKSIYKIIDSEEPQDEEKINHLQRQITLLNKASICTIDSFCLDVIKNYFLEEDAIGVVEIILILVILIALVLIFKTKITSVVTKAFTNFTRDTGKILA